MLSRTELINQIPVRRHDINSASRRLTTCETFHIGILVISQVTPLARKHNNGVVVLNVIHVSGSHPFVRVIQCSSF